MKRIDQIKLALLIAGFLFVTGGIALWSIPTSLIAAGLMIFCLLHLITKAERVK